MDNQLFWQKISQDYVDLVGEEGDIHHRLVINPIVAKLLGNLQAKVVLDAACGNGYLSRRMAKTAHKVFGIDFTEKFIELAKEQSKNFSNLEFAVGNLEKLPYSDHFFDVVLCNMALINVENLALVITELARVLKVNGSLVASITRPCFENPPHAYTLRDKKGKKTGRIITSYFPTGAVINTENNHLHYHYALSDYLNLFAKANLFLEKTVEPNDAEMTGESEKDIVPIFLLMKLRKIK